MATDLGDRLEDDVIYFAFHTNGTTGAPATLSGSPALSVYKQNNTTQTTAGITLTVDFDGVTGLNVVEIITLDAFYAVFNDYHVVITTGTVGGTSVVGYVVAEFSIQNRATHVVGLAPDIVNASSLATDAVTEIRDAILSDSTAFAGANIDAAITTRATPAQVATELATYDGPTHTELTSEINDVQADIAALNNISTAQVNSEVDGALADYDGPTYTEILNLVRLLARSDAALVTDLSALITTLNADLGSGAGAYANTDDSQEALRLRGDVAWITGGGGGLTQAINPILAIPPIIDLSDTASVRIGIILTNTLDDLPTTAEITPGTITISRKAQGGTSWSDIVTAEALTEQDGFVYYDEVFDSGSGYAAGDMIRFQFESVSVTADANTYNITGATGVFVYSYVTEIGGGGGPTAAQIRQEIDSNSTQLAKLGTPATDVSADIAAVKSDSAAILVDTGTSGVIVNAVTAGGIADFFTVDGGETYDSAVAGSVVKETADNAGGSALTVEAIRAEIDDNSTQLAAIVADTNELQADWQDNGRLDMLIDSIVTAAVGAIPEIATVTDIPITPTLKQAAMLLYMEMRNNSQATASERRIVNDAGTEVLDASMSDDATTFQQGKLGTPS